MRALLTADDALQRLTGRRKNSGILNHGERHLARDYWKAMEEEEVEEGIGASPSPPSVHDPMPSLGMKSVSLLGSSSLNIGLTTTSFCCGS